MIWLRFIVALVAIVPLIYYLLALLSAWKFFRRRRDTDLSAARKDSGQPGFAPPVSNLKPVRGLDPGAYENFASFCRQDYPQYEVIFCVSDDADPALPVLRQVVRNFPDRDVRLLVGSGRDAPNDKVAKLVRMTNEAKYETLVISDSDVRVNSDYLRRVVADLGDPRVGATTCFYLSAPGQEKSFAQELHSVGMICDFYAGLLVARELDGVKFTLGPTIATTKAHLESFGGYAALENRPADDLLVGRLIAAQGYEVRLLNYPVFAVSDFHSLRDLFLKRLRWTVVMRNMRPWGHAGTVLTFGLFWSLAAVLANPSWAVALGYFGAYAFFRAAMTLAIGAWGLRQREVFRKLWLVPVWDLAAVFLWVASFTRNRIRWRGEYYVIRQGKLVPQALSSTVEEAAEHV